MRAKPAAGTMHESIQSDLSEPPTSNHSKPYWPGHGQFSKLGSLFRTTQMQDGSFFLSNILEAFGFSSLHRETRA